MDDELWNEVKARQVAMRRATSNGDPARFNRARRPKFLFSGLTKCGECGGGYVIYWRDRLLHPRMADVYREKVGSLCLALENEESRTSAVDAIRALIEAIVLEPDGDQLKITLKGDLAGMLSAARDSKRSPETGDLLLQIKLVAGARNRQYRLISPSRLPSTWWRHESLRRGREITGVPVRRSSTAAR